MLMTLRCALFYLLYNGAGFWYGLSGWAIGWLPYETRARYIRGWNFCAMFFSRWLLNIKVQLNGRENIPDGVCVVMSKHQSQWETFYLQTLFPIICTILKKELLDIPFFGWGLKKLEPIAIDRSNPKAALKQIQQVGLQRLEQGRKVLIFPEGTRVPVGEKKKFARSGANLAVAANVPVLPIAHNAGKYWPADKFLKNPGTITVTIGSLIEPDGKTAKELTEEVEQWIESESARLLEI